MADVERARESFARHEWRTASDSFLAAEADLDCDDLEKLAVSAYLVGKNAESDAAWTRTHQIRLAAGDLTGAVRCAFWLAFRLVNAHDRPGGNGWIARIERLLDDVPADSLDHARLAYLTGLRAAFEGDLATSETDLTRSSQLAWRFRDSELTALARLALGRMLIFRGEITRGVRLLDEAMLAVGSDPFSPIAVGDSYCTAIDACYDLFDVHRGQAWTDELTRWCAQQPDLVPFAGICQVHRSEFLQVKGAWVEAMAQAGLARARLAEPFRQLAYGAAVYQQGEMHRLRGDLESAEACYREASDAGRDPQPGLALLRLSQGRLAIAAQAIDRALAAEGDARGALVPLRLASDEFREIGAPYEVARTCTLIGGARRALGDEEGAELEVDAARSVFERLGARPELARLDGTATTAATALTARELQVLRLIARGSTNRSIGAELGLSERTVDRHVSNIFAKLGVSSRAAATALAYESELL